MIVDGKHGGTEQFIRVQWDYRCGCVNPERQAFETVSDKQLAMFNTLGKAMEDEFWRVLFRKRTWHFPCCCCLYHNLDDGTLCRYLRNVHIHWCGPKADKAFEQLATDCPKLRNLTIKISKATLRHLNRRHQQLATFSPQAYTKPRITDCLGIEERLRVRKIDNVVVEHVRSAQSAKLTEFERQGLRSLLEATIKQPF